MPKRFTAKENTIAWLMIFSAQLLIFSLITGVEETSVRSNGSQNEECSAHSESGSPKPVSSEDENRTIRFGEPSIANQSLPGNAAAALPLPANSAQFLLNNPWLQTSVLYSQLCTQREQRAPLETKSDIPQCDSTSCTNASKDQQTPSPEPRKILSASSTSSSTESNKSPKRTEVWRPY